MADLLDRVVLPVADPEDAEASVDALADHEFGSVLVVHVIEKAGGAPDTASVEQREEYAEEVFGAARDRFDEGGDVETRVAYGTDVAETIFETAEEYGATAVVVTPRGGSRWVRLVTGDVALSLVTENDRPVVVLPDAETDEQDTGADEQDGGTDEPDENGGGGE